MQFGFRPNKSSKLALSRVIELLLDTLDGGNVAAATFIELSKAFDLVKMF